jgi:hypothetical protein
VELDDWESGRQGSGWPPDFDVRTVVADLPVGHASLSDFRWGAKLEGDNRLVEISDSLQVLKAGGAAVEIEELRRLRRLTCPEGNTSVFGPGIVSSLVGMVASGVCHSPAEILQLVGDLARMDIQRLELREELLHVMRSVQVYDSWGFLENWAVEAVRVVVGRDVRLLVALLDDDEPRVRSRAAYVLVSALPIDRDTHSTIRARLVVETHPAVQMVLVLCVAQHLIEGGQVLDGLAWAQSLWSDVAMPASIRLGGAISWLGLTSADAPTELREFMVEAALASEVEDLLAELPWVWWLKYREDGIASWLRDLCD